MKYLAAIIGLVLMGSAAGEVKQEVVESPSMCGPFDELQDLILSRGGYWFASGLIPTRKIYYFINKKTGEVYILHPIEGVYCVAYDVVTGLRINRNAVIDLLQD